MPGRAPGRGCVIRRNSGSTWRVPCAASRSSISSDGGLMPDVQFGVCLPIFACPGVQLFRTPAIATLDPGTVLPYGRAAETLGYDSLWVADHLMLGKDEAIL